MSRDNLWQICHKNRRGNRLITQNIVGAVRERKITSKKIADDINVSTERVRNWYYRSTGLTALDLLMLMGEYDFIEQLVVDIVLEYKIYKEE